MTLILDASGLSALAGNRAKLIELRDRGLWPPQVPALVLVEALTSDGRLAGGVHRLLASCQVREVDERVFREAARLRAMSGRADQISPVSAVVAAFAASHPEPVVITRDRGELDLLAAHAMHPVTVVAV
ncbi:MAG: hypothetical protein Q4F67_06665 [Propionibacteriaceae bacterium]|nr:hypothetical protein [Propionibacteriaceae bacterium]